LDHEDPRRVQVLSTLAAHLTFDDDRQRRVQLLAEADSLARRLDDPALVGTVLVAEYLCLWDPTTFERRADVVRELRRVARASGDVDHTFFAGFLAAICAVERAQLDDAVELLRGLDEAITATQNFYFRFLVNRLLVSIDVYRCKPDVQPAIDELAARYDDTHADTRGTWALQTGFVAFRAGQLATLLPALREM
ncbi:hypothetical protein B7486_74775, partial [cyanobacterium TDX16]